MGGNTETNGIGTGETINNLRGEDITTFDTSTEPTGNTNGTENLTTNEAGGLKPPQRKRGRPFGWRKDKTTDSEKSSIDFQEEKITNSTEGLTRKRKKAFMNETEANSTTQFILSTIDMLGVALLKTEEAKLNPIEKAMLSQSIPKYLQTLETTTIDKAANLMYPLMGILGFSMYGLRVASIVVDKRKENQQKQEIQKEHDNATTSAETINTNGENQEWSTQPNLQNDLNMQNRIRKI